MTDGSVARVLLDSPLPQLDRLFDYRVPAALVADLTPGVRVRVPVRAQRRIMDGFVVEVVARSDYDGPLVEIEELVSPVSVLAPEVWRLARGAADRSVGVASDVLRLAIPKRQVRVERAVLTADAPAATPFEALPITDYPPALAAAIVAGERLVVQAVPRPLAWAHTATQLASQVLAAGRTAIAVLPDARDIERLLAAAAAVLPPERIVRLDSDQTPGERYRAFLRARLESGLLIVGNRSAVYAPAERLGLVLVWDDGDPALREPLAPGLHPREAALLRQEQQGAALVLLAHAPSTDAQRLVEIGWCRPVRPSTRVAPDVLPTGLQVGAERLAELARIPSSAWRIAAEAIRDGPVLVQVARPGEEAPGGSVRTAADLGRAFPNARVIVADAAHPVREVEDAPALVIATRGAEPVAAGGYRAVLLLDGERMLARESLRVVEDGVRNWANAAALAAPGARVVLVGVTGPLARDFAAWRLPELAAEELADRRAVRMPPAVRTATLTGRPAAVDAAISAAGIPGDDVIAPVELEDGLLRTIVRFDYRRGPAVAGALRTEILRHAAGRRPRGAAAPTLRVRMDDPAPFVAPGDLG